MRICQLKRPHIIFYNSIVSCKLINFVTVAVKLLHDRHALGSKETRKDVGTVNIFYCESTRKLKYKKVRI